MSTLITGANGTIGSALLRVLKAGDTEIRALVRDPEKAPDLPGLAVIAGDLDSPRSLGSAFEGVDTLWLLTAMGPQAPHQSMNAVWAARQAGVRHIVRVSAVGAAYGAPTRNGRLLPSPKPSSGLPALPGRSSDPTSSCRICSEP